MGKLEPGPGQGPLREVQVHRGPDRVIHPVIGGQHGRGDGHRHTHNRGTGPSRLRGHLGHHHGPLRTTVATDGSLGEVDEGPGAHMRVVKRAEWVEDRSQVVVGGFRPTGTEGGRPSSERDLREQRVCTQGQ
jgi:hypothetical protein